MSPPVDNGCEWFSYPPPEQLRLFPVLLSPSISTGHCRHKSTRRQSASKCSYSLPRAGTCTFMWAECMTDRTSESNQHSISLQDRRMESSSDGGGGKSGACGGGCVPSKLPTPCASYSSSSRPSTSHHRQEKSSMVSIIMYRTVMFALFSPPPQPIDARRRSIIACEGW